MTATNGWEEKLSRISMKREPVMDIFQRCTFGGSTLMFCQIFDGVVVWPNEIRDKYIPFFPETGGNYITFNYCAGGRCEIGFPVKNRYIYMKKGMISLNQVQPVDGYYYPGRKYDGLELAFDLDVLGDRFPAVLADYGLTGETLMNLIRQNDSLMLAVAGQQFQMEADRLFSRFITGKVTMEELRFEMLRFFYLLKEEGMSPAEDTVYVSRGQRQIATEVEERLTADLSAHHVLADLAGEYGISASALKKYFTRVYGHNVSEYLRIKRMETAMMQLRKHLKV